MKSAYFTKDTLKTQTERLLDQYRNPRREVISIDVSSTALLILDMQQYFLNSASHAFVPSAPAILDGLLTLARKFSHHGGLVQCTQHVNSADNPGLMATWWRDLLTSDHAGYPLVPDAQSQGLPCIQKSQYDAFLNTELEAILKGKGIETVIVTGVMTHLCCESTARSAFMRGFNVLFPVDGTATITLNHHQATLLNLAHGFASLTSIHELQQCLEGS